MEMRMEGWRDGEREDGKWEMGTRVPVAVFVLGKALGVAVDFLVG
jgi:hypothetical protein